MTKKKVAHKHAFRFRIQEPGEKPQVITAWATVKKLKTCIDLIVTVEDVLRSIQLKGVGNTQTCTMAICTKRLAKLFPHPVEGYVDWQYSRAYVVTKKNKTTNLPSECVVYEHSDDIAKLNDSLGGQKALLKQLEANGPRTIRLKASRKRLNERTPAGKPPGRATGERKSRVNGGGYGANLRYANAHLGGALAEIGAA